MVLRCAWLTIILINLVMPSPAGAQDNLPLKVDRLGEKVLTISSMTGNSRVVALATQKGLVVIDSMWSPAIARETKSRIATAFGRDDFAYLVLMNDFDLSSGGTEAFPQAQIISHQKCRESLSQNNEQRQSYLRRRAAWFEGRARATEAQLEDMDAESADAEFKRRWIVLCDRIAHDLNKGYRVVPPQITFDDRITLDLGDMTLQLIYFGEASNAGDLVAWVPEEGLVFLGDMFHGLHVLSDPHTHAPFVPRWLNTLDYLLDEAHEIKYVLRANSQEVWTPARLRAQRDFIRDLHNKVVALDAQGLNLEQATAALSVDDFPYVKDWYTWTKAPDIIQNDIARFIASVWKTLNTSAADEVESALRSSGIQDAINRFSEIRNNADFYLFEREFNSLGYKLLGEERIDDALAVFKLVVETWPDSWNAYDSLAEACLNNGQEELAKEYYLKSLELNPENENAKTILKQLKEK